MIFIALICVLVPKVFAGSVVLIVNASSLISSIELEEVQKIFLGKQKKWDSGSRIYPVLLRQGTVHKSFLEDLIKMPSRKFNTYWKRMIFTGKATALKTFTAESQIIEFVALHPGSIGYVSTEAIDASGNTKVKELSIGGKEMLFY